MAEFPHNIAVVADHSTALGFQLAGVQTGFQLADIKTVHVAEKKSAEKKIEELLAQPDLGIIIVTEEIFSSLDWRLRKKIERIAKPVVIAVPDKFGPKAEDKESIKALIRRALGVDLTR